MATPCGLRLRTKKAANVAATAFTDLRCCAEISNTHSLCHEAGIYLVRLLIADLLARERLIIISLVVRAQVRNVVDLGVLPTAK